MEKIAGPQSFLVPSIFVCKQSPLLLVDMPRGLEVMKLWPSSCYIKHPATPWYVVCIQALKQNRQHLSRYQRFTLAVGSADAAYKAFSHLRRIAGLGESKILKRLTQTAKSLLSSSATSTASGGRIQAQERSQAPHAIIPEAIWSR